MRSERGVRISSEESGDFWYIDYEYLALSSRYRLYLLRVRAAQIANKQRA